MCVPKYLALFFFFSFLHAVDGSSPASARARPRGGRRDGAAPGGAAAALHRQRATPRDAQPRLWQPKALPRRRGIPVQGPAHPSARIMRRVRWGRRWNPRGRDPPPPTIRGCDATECSPHWPRHTIPGTHRAPHRRDVCVTRRPLPAYDMRAAMQARLGGLCELRGAASRPHA